MVFQESWKGVLRKFQEYFKEFAYMCQERLMGISKEIEGCFEEVLVVF